MHHIIKLILILGFIYVLFSGATFIVDFIPNFINNQVYGPEYCFKDISQSDISVAANGVSVRYTKTEGDELCFRTKDSSIVERLNKQIQDRKYQERLAEIEANKEIWKTALIILGFIVIVGFISVILSERRSYGI